MRRPATLVVLSAFAFTCAAAATHAWQMSPAPAASSPFFEGLKYRLVGPSRGGRVTTVTGVPSQPKTFYMGVASGGVFKTIDAGVTWTPITDGQVPLGSTGSIAVADSDPNVIYLGTGSDDVRSNVSTGRGVYKSTDAGKTWSFVGLYNIGQVGGVRIHPTDPNTVWVAAQGDAFKPNPERGVFKTTDGGKTWRKTMFIADNVGAMDVELQPGNPNTVYVWFSHLQRKPWTIESGGQGGRVLQVHRRRRALREDHGRAAGGLDRQGESRGDRRESESRVRAHRSQAGRRALSIGRCGADVGGDGEHRRPIISRPFYYVALGADPTNADVVYGGAESFFKSVDGGKTFQAFRAPHGDHHDIWISPKDGNVMIQSNDGGANVSTDGGRTWSTQSNQPTAEIYGVWTDDQFPYKLYGAQQDSSTRHHQQQRRARSR